MTSQQLARLGRMGDRVPGAVDHGCARQTAHLIAVGAGMAGRMAAFWRGFTRQTVSQLGWLNPRGRIATQAATRSV